MGRLALALAILLAVAAPAAARFRMPDSTSGAKRCAADLRTREGSHFRVYVTEGRRLVSCRRARSIVRQGVNVHGWRYYDWTKGGNGPWSDVWRRRDHRAVVGAVLRCVEGLDNDDDLPPCYESRQP